MPKVALELIHLTRNQQKFYILPDEPDFETVQQLLDFDTFEWEFADDRVRNALNGVRIDECDMEEGTLTHWFELVD